MAGLDRDAASPSPSGAVPSPDYRVVIGDARRMERIEDDAVRLVVTSPPYWQLKDYGPREQIGFHQSYEEYLEELGKVWAECARVVHPGCRIAINIGDQFARAATYGRYRVIPIHAAIIARFEELGVDFMGSIIWQKVTTCNTSGGGAVMGSFPFPRNGIVKLDYEHILIFKRPGKPPRVEPEVKERARMSTEEWNTCFYGHWTFPGARQEEHIAVFPEELPRRLIRMFSFPGELVLDPFLGSGTTLKVAREQGRGCVGYELDESCLDVIRQKAGFGAERDLLAAPAELEIVREASVGSPSATTPGDDLGGTQRVVATSSRYGSVVRRGDSGQREDYVRVRVVVDGRTLELADGRVVRLLGLEERPDRRADAVAELERLALGRQVYLRTDERVTDEDLLYVHLRNRTCLNSKLVRSGAVRVDRTRDYRMRRRFERYADEAARL